MSDGREGAAAPTGRKTTALGNALGLPMKNTPSPEGAKELRSGWKLVRLGDIAQTTSGGTPRRDRPHYYGGTVPWIKSGELGDRVVYEASEFLTDEGLASSNAKLFPKGTLCIALYGATVGRLGILGIDAATNQAVCAVFPPESLDTRFLYHFFESKRRDLIEQGKGGAQSNISQGIIRDTLLPLPPLPEQRRIVAEIEKQFTRLEAGVTALRRVQANLKRYRAAVLKAACEGRLVPTEAELARQRLTAKNAKMEKNASSFAPFAVQNSEAETGEALLARILTERRQNWQGRGQYKEPAAPDTANLPAIPDGWTWASVEQLGRATTGFTPPKNDASLFGGGIPFFKPSDLDVGYYVREFRDSLTDAGAEQGRVLPPLSILVTCIGATIGKTGLARVRCTTNQQINALTVSAELVSPQFVYWCFSSPFGQRHIIDNASATTLPILNKSRFEALPIPLPPLAEQARIVAEVERRLSVVEELAAVVSANLQRATRLRQSILQRAFTGRL